MKLLGKTLDIHGGGLDLQFPHHENELAQSESYTGVPFARYWMHNGLMKIGAGKMSKSLGNEVVVSELLRVHHPETLRFFLLTTHYRRPIDYGEDRLEEIRRGLDGFYRFFERFQRITKEDFYKLQAPTARGSFAVAGVHAEFLTDVSRYRETFLVYMDDDFNTGGAVGVLYDLLTTLNRFADSQELEKASANPAALQDFRRGALVLKELSQTLGIFSEPVAAGPASSNELTAGLMQLLIDMRAEARKTKNFALADQIRQRLSKLNITLEDRPGATDWRVG